MSDRQRQYCGDDVEYPSHRSSFNDRSANVSHYDRSGEGEMETQLDTVFVQRLPENCTRQDLAQAFGAIGVVKMDRRTGQPKIWIYKDKVTGRGKGEATVTYEDPNSADAAIKWFNGKEVMGQVVSVQLATRRRNMNYGGGGGGGGGFSRRSYETRGDRRYDDDTQQRFRQSGGGGNRRGMRYEDAAYQENDDDDNSGRGYGRTSRGSRGQRRFYSNRYDGRSSGQNNKRFDDRRRQDDRELPY
ncbi:hypothetical protein ACOME3_010640 [Neoechinorhynchus agilis]